MRFAILSTLLAVFVTYAMAVAPLKSVIISYPNDTPQSVVDQAMESIKAAGGEITHIYNIIKGFACMAPATILESVQTMNTEHQVTIEEDQVVRTQEQGMGMGF
ncbi:hypothetical protein P154DRAFT_488535 [Amniculicola lignicola CBS 123094]|uniref:Inhibitor I9 domain-containing protein n=1 Tax=Amniculicola lignicola CBS 123094 TaxID=1392246 RepID=A0A6A5WQP6_9PLEO|nr:hypothetical protein P154DRAFT_488535 [Amniculicola lignicola CBS 123094]